MEPIGGGTPDNLNGMIISVGADLSPLQSALDAIPGIAQAASNNLSNSMAGAASSADTLTGSLAAAATAATGLGSGAQSASSGIDAMSSAASSAAAPFDAIAAAIARVSTEFDGQKQALSAAQANLEIVQAAYEKGAASAGQFQQALKELEAAELALNGTTQTMQERLRGTAQEFLATGAAVSAISLPIAALGAAALETAGKFEQSQVAFTTLLGDADAAKKMLADLIDFGIRTPFQIQGLVDASQKLLAMGTEAKDVIPTLTSLGDAVSGLGKGQAGLTQIVDVFARMRAEVNLTARDFQGFRALGVNAAQILADAFGITAEQLLSDVSKKLVKTADVIPILLEGMNEKFGGMMQAQSQTLLGAWTNIQDQITKTLKAIGDQLTPFAKQAELVIKEVLDVVQGAAEAFGQLPEPVKVFTVALAAAAAVAGPLLVVLGGLALALSAVSVPLLTITAASVGAVAAIAGIASALSSIKIPEGFKDFLKDVVYFVEIAAAFGAAAAGVTAAMNLLIVAIEGVSAALAVLSIESIIASFTTFTAAIGNTITQLILMGEAAWTANTALGAMVSAVSLVAAAFVGWEIGKLLYDNVQWIHNMGDAIADLLLQTPGVNRLLEALTGISSANRQVAAANDSLTASIDKLKASLAAHNVVIQQGSMSNEEYSRTLRTAAAALNDVNEPAASYQKTVTQLGIEHQKLQDALKAARQELTNVTAAFKNGLANQADLTAATEKYRAALAAANPELTHTGVIIDANAKATENWNKQWDIAATKALDTFKQMVDGSVSPTAAIAKLGSALESASTSTVKLSDKSKDLKEKLQEALMVAQDAEIGANWEKAFTKLQESMEATEQKAADMAAKVPADFESMMEAINSGQTVIKASALDKMLADMRVQLLALPDQWKAGFQQAIDSTQAITDNLHGMENAAKLLAADKSVDLWGAEVTGLIAQLDNGQISAEKFETGMTSAAAQITSKVIPALERGAEITPAFMRALQDLARVAPDIGQPLLDAALKGVSGFDQLGQAAIKTSEIARLAAISIDTAFSDLGVTSLDKLSNTFTRFSNDVVAAFATINGRIDESSAKWPAYSVLIDKWAADALVAMQSGIAVTGAVVDALNKIDPALAAAAQSGNWQAFQVAFDNFKQRGVDAATSVEQAYRRFGETAVSELQRILTSQQNNLNLLIATNAPMAAQLTALEKELQTRMQIASATDETGMAEARLAVQTLGVQAAIFATHQATNGLSDAILALGKGLSQIWDQFDKSLASAIVAGNGFGDVFKKLLTDIETMIVEVAVKYITGQLITALISSIGLSGTLTGVMTTLGISSQATGAAVTASMATAATAMTTAAASMAASSTAMATAFSGAALVADESGAQISTSMGTAASATATAAGVISASMMEIVVVVGAVAAVIGAIAGIIGDIQQAHTNKLLGEIEVTTRKTWEVTGGNGDVSIFGFTRYSMLYLKTIMDTIWNPIVPLLTSISGTLDDIKGAGGFAHGQVYSTDIPQQPGNPVVTDLGPMALTASQAVGSLGNSATVASTALTSVSTATAAATTAMADAVTTATTSMSAATGQVSDATLKAIAASDASIIASNQAAKQPDTYRQGPGGTTTDAFTTVADLMAKGITAATIDWAVQHSQSNAQQVLDFLAAGLMPTGAAGGGGLGQPSAFAPIPTDNYTVQPTSIVDNGSKSLQLQVQMYQDELAAAQAQLAKVKQAYDGSFNSIINLNSATDAYNQAVADVTAAMQAQDAAMAKVTAGSDSFGAAMQAAAAAVAPAVFTGNQVSAGIGAGGITITPVQPFQFSSQGGTGSPSTGVGTAIDRTGGLTIQHNLQIGTLVGQNGMQQLSDMLAAATVTKLQQVAGLRISY